MRGAPPGSIAAVCHPSGWVQTNIMTKWRDSFLRNSKSSKKSCILLLLDRHFTHKRKIEVIQMERENSFYLYLHTSTHTTHILPPSDKSLTWPLKTDSSYLFGVFGIMEHFAHADFQVQWGYVAVNCFKATGIYSVSRIISQKESASAIVVATTFFDTDTPPGFDLLNKLRQFAA
ncbi:hypothetical protein PR048_021117 [Dryococelus australis]|uniref:DDE-1 domain-containing protein n=1 Tax=Dryococelus australis TaxID=614101 RepID=A0ABQ9GXC1_9NEOP|nr:hypothetical protein PR048_021117 [Dryococelus australis]